MTTTVRVFFFLLLLPAFLRAQVNLVPNPSFEADSMAPPITTFHWQHYEDWRKDSISRVKNSKLVLARDWYQVTSGTPDHLNSPKSHLLGFKTKTARTGKGRMGIISGICENGLVSWLLYRNTYSEYIGCKLSRPLEAGKTYSVRYYVALDRKSNFASNRFGAAITHDSIRKPDTHTLLWSVTPQVIANDDHYITSDEGWVMICGTFVAKGGEQFLTIGSFAETFPKRVHQVKRSEHGSLRVSPFNKFAYYYIDDVSLTEVLPGEQLCVPPRDSIARNNLVFLLDVSGSMEQKGLIAEAKSSIIPLVNTLPPGDNITIITYGDLPKVLVDHVTAADTAAIRIALDSIDGGGGTNAVGGFTLAYATIRKRMMPGGTNKIIVLSDGKIYLPKKHKQMVFDAAENEGIQLSVIFFGDNLPEDVVKFAEKAGGHATAAEKGNADEALRKEVPAQVTDTPYGERNAGRIVAWEALTKVLFPALLVLLVLRGTRVI